MTAFGMRCLVDCGGKLITSSRKMLAGDHGGFQQPVRVGVEIQVV